MAESWSDTVSFIKSSYNEEDLETIFRELSIEEVSKNEAELSQVATDWLNERENVAKSAIATMNLLFLLETLVAKAHSAISLEQIRALGKTQVGPIAEVFSLRLVMFEQYWSRRHKSPQELAEISLQQARQQWGSKSSN